MNSLLNGLYLNTAHWAQMEADVRARAPEEACGIVVGQGNHSRLVIPVTNILHSQYRFRMDKPSATDFEELTFPGIIYLIWYIGATQWNCRGYLMNPRMDAVEVPVIISEEK
jgi:hypothetical protein